MIRRSVSKGSSQVRIESTTDRHLSSSTSAVRLSVLHVIVTDYTGTQYGRFGPMAAWAPMCYAARTRSVAGGSGQK